MHVCVTIYVLRGILLYLLRLIELVYVGIASFMLLCYICVVVAKLLESSKARVSLMRRSLIEQDLVDWRIVVHLVLGVVLLVVTLWKDKGHSNNEWETQKHIAMQTCDHMLHHCFSSSTFLLQHVSYIQLCITSIIWLFLH